MAHTVGVVAAITGATVRTLHHYDEVGLLAPAGRSAAGYRLYEQQDLERLQEILFFRELGMSLDEIRRAVTDPEYDRGSALERHRTMLQRRAARLHSMIEAIDDAIRAYREGREMTDEGLFEVFGDFDPRDYEAEAEERWGATEAYAESKRRTSAYSKQQWTAIMAEGDEISRELAGLLRSGVDADAAAAMAAAERHRRYIDRWFYTCSHEMHDGLGQMYTSDPRFTETWDRYEPGLAAFVSTAITANALRG